ncbi:MAG: DEAD/DEAH box helicase, partial [Proteobacteria bacterium]
MNCSHIDEVSRAKTQEAKRLVVISTAILWTYRKANWDGLREFIMLALCRVGYPPSTAMVDSDYNANGRVYSGLDSLLNQFAISVFQLDHEIFVQDQKYLVTDFQKNVWNKLSNVKLLGISAPTSAGKSFIILLKAVDLILKQPGNIIYIVPTLSLVAQVSADFNIQLKKFGLENYRICTTYSPENGAIRRIYVLTQEKAISAFGQLGAPFENVRALIVDEIQNIEKADHEDDQRSKTLYDTLIEFSHSSKLGLVVLSGPRVEGLKELGIEIFKEDISEEEKTRDSPVASFTYAISKVADDYFFNQYCDLISAPNRLPVTNKELIKGYGGSVYKDDFYQYLAEFTDGLGEKSKNIIFSPTTAQARKTALRLAELKTTSESNEMVGELISYIKATVHDNYDLVTTIPKGVAYHHGKTPSHVRSVLEHAIRNKLIENVVCTTTLMQGVNLPAQNIIMRNPDLAIKAKKGIKPKLTNYEIANLRGRAG